MISLDEYKKICFSKKINGFKSNIENEFSVFDVGKADETLIEVIYELGIIANKEIGNMCYLYKEHIQFIDLIYQLKKKENFILAIDGMCGSGKSTLASLLERIFQVNVFHMDDFYLPLEKRTQERLSIPGGNVDYERFIETVLKPISLKQQVHYQTFICSDMKLSDEITIINYHNKIIIEGSYSLRPELVPYYTDTVVLRINPLLQLERLTKRNPSSIKQFKEKWIPLENNYFTYYKIFDQYKVIDIY